MSSNSNNADTALPKQINSKDNTETIEIVSGECNNCEYDRLKEITDKVTSTTVTVCNACDEIQGGGGGMYKNNITLEKIKLDEKHGLKIGSTTRNDIIDLETKTGNPYISLVSPNNVSRLNKQEILVIFKMLLLHTPYKREDMKNTLSKSERTRLANILTSV